MKYSMMRYIEEYKNKSFHEYPFNPVDALLLSQLAYPKMEKIVPGFRADHYPTLKEIHEDPDYEALFTDPVYGQMYHEIFEEIYDSVRYGDIQASFFMKVSRRDQDCNFAAITFRKGNHSFVAFRGTDGKINAWKEDFNLACEKVIPSQNLALSYLKGAARRTQGKLILSGHSKGGNIALYAASKAPLRIQDRIQRIFSFDGVGFPRSFYGKKGFQRISDRIYKVIPRESTVGLLFSDHCNPRIVKSYKHGLVQHDLMNWKIKDGRFQYCRSLKRSSKNLGNRLNRWIGSLTQTEIREYINCLYQLIGGYEKTMVYELKPTEILSRIHDFIRHGDAEEKEQFLRVSARLLTC